jgi:O-antigen/teichoic acid export membrane protein
VEIGRTMSSALANGYGRPPASLTVSTFWLLLAKTISFAITIVLPLLIVRRLSQVEFGHYKQVFLVVNTANTLLPLGFGMTAFYFFPREPDRRGQVMFHILLVYSSLGAMAAGALLLFPNILTVISGDSGLTEYSSLLAALIPLWILSYLIELVPVIQKEFSTATLFIVGSQDSRTTLLLLAATIYGTVRSLLIAAVVHCSIQTVVLLRYTGVRFPKFWRHIDRELLMAQFKYAMPLAYTAAIWAFQNDLHSYFVSHIYGPAAFAIYATGCFQIPLMGLLSEAAASVLIGKMSELRLEGNTEEMIALTARVMRKLAAAIFPVYAFLLVCGQEFIVLLFTRNYAASWPVFAINITLVLLLPLMLDPIMRAYPECMPYLLKMRTAIFIVIVACLWLFVGRYGPLAAITIAVVTTVADRALIARHLSRFVRFRSGHLSLFRDTPKLAFCAALAALATAVLRLQLTGFAPIVILLVCGVVFMTIYIGAALLMRIAAPEEIASLLRLARSPRGLLFG